MTEKEVNEIDSFTKLQKFPSGEDYRKYLKRGGVIDALKKVLVALYDEPEWPISPNEYICKKLAELCNMPLFEKLKADFAVMQEKEKLLQQTIDNLETELKKYKSGSSNEQNSAESNL